MGFIKAGGIVGSVLALIVVAIALIKQLIAFIGFLTFVIKAAIFLGFILIFLSVAFVVFRAWSTNKRQKE